jgi:pilus assembly protein CpaE
VNSIKLSNRIELSDKIKLLIADDIGETREVIKKLLNMEKDSFEVVGEACNGEEVLQLIPKVKPEVVLMDINMPIMNGLEATERITNEFPGVVVIIMSVQGEIEYLKKAMLHGAKEYVIKPFNYDTLIDTLKITYEKHKSLSIKRGSHVERDKDAKIITFFSSKGGVGKSVLAVNSGVVLSTHGNKKTLLMDMNLQFGDVSMLVNEYAEKTILDVIDDGQMEAFENIKPYLHKYNDNMDILFAPRKPESAEYISKDSVERLMKIFKKNYDVILIDTGINFNETTLYILDQAEIILYVTTMEIVAMKNTKLGFGVMHSLGYDNNKVKLIINRVTTSYGISKKEVEAVFSDNIFAMIPVDENTVSISVNNGKPFCNNIKLGKLKIVKAIEEMCKALQNGCL